MIDRISSDEVHVLRAEIARQRAQLQRLEDALHSMSGEPRDTGEQTVSRRGLLAGAAGLVGAGIASVAAAQPAAAATGDDLVLGESNTATDTTDVTAELSGAATLSVENTASTGSAVTGLLGPDPSALVAAANAGVVGASKGSPGVAGYSHSTHGVYGSNNDLGHGVHGKGFVGVYGEGNDQFGTGVVGFSKRDNGVFGQSEHGTAVLGVSFHGDALGGNSTDEYGVVAQGGRAPIRLVPGQGVGAPSHGKHKAGELYVDSEGSLFFCVKLGHHGGTWVRLAHR